MMICVRVGFGRRTSLAVLARPIDSALHYLILKQGFFRIETPRQFLLGKVLMQIGVTGPADVDAALHVFSTESLLEPLVPVHSSGNQMVECQPPMLAAQLTSAQVYALVGCVLLFFH